VSYRTSPFDGFNRTKKNAQRKTIMNSERQLLFIALAIAALSALLVLPTNALASESGQRTFGQASVEPAFDDSTGGPVYLLTPVKAPLPLLLLKSTHALSVAGSAP
jgi:hypothetical protein